MTTSDWGEDYSIFAVEPAANDVKYLLEIKVSIQKKIKFSEVNGFCPCRNGKELNIAQSSFVCQVRKVFKEK